VTRSIVLNRNLDFSNRNKSPINPLTKEQPFTHLRFDRTAETSLVRQQRYRNCSVQSAGLTVAWFQVLSAELPLSADGSGLVGFGAVPGASKDRVASIFRVKHSFEAVPKLWITCKVLTGNVEVTNKPTNIPSNYSSTCSGHSLCNSVCGVNSLRTEVVHY